MVTRVYAPDGEPFDIPRRDTADKLILEKGWTQTPPTFEDVKKAPKKTSRKTKSKSEDKEAVDKPEENFQSVFDALTERRFSDAEDFDTTGEDQ